MRPATGTHNLRRLREFLNQQQDEFSVAIHLSKSMLQKLEAEKKPLKPHVAETIAASTGISAQWLNQNDPAAPLVDSKGKPYTRERYERAQVHSHWKLLVPTKIQAPVLVRMQFLKYYARTRDLFLRPEMYKHFINFVMKLELLYRQFDLEADYPEEMSAKDFQREERKRLNPDKLYAGVIADANRCRNAEKRQRARREREEAESITPFLPPKDKGTPRRRN